MLSGSSELQPAERLWPQTDEALANRPFEEISEVEDALVKRCVELLDQPEIIRGLMNYHALRLRIVTFLTFDL